LCQEQECCFTEEENQGSVQQQALENAEVDRDVNVTVTRSGRVVKPGVRPIWYTMIQLMLVASMLNMERILVKLLPR
jgi:hypothetical protein